jgi:regulatory protein
MRRPPRHRAKDGPAKPAVKPAWFGEDQDNLSVLQGVGLEEPDGDRCREAMDRAGRYLAIRPRTEQEVRAKLADAGFEAAVVDEVIGRLSDLRLVDDHAFARAWVTERSRTLGRAGVVLIAELVGKGVSREVAEAAVDEAAPEEESHAAEVAATLLRKVARLPLTDQAARLQQMLLRRGFAVESAAAGVRAVLPPEGWD